MTELPQLQVLRTKVMNVWLDDITVFAPVDISLPKDTLRCEVKLSAATKRAIVHDLLDQEAHDNVLLYGMKWVSDNHVCGIDASEKITLPDVVDNILVPDSAPIGAICRNTLAVYTGDATLVGAGCIDVELFIERRTNAARHALYAKVTNVTFRPGSLRCADLHPYIERNLDDVGSALADFTSKNSLIATASDLVHRPRKKPTSDASTGSPQATRGPTKSETVPVSIELDMFSEAHHLPDTKLWVCVSHECCKEGETIYDEEDMQLHLLLYHADKVARITGVPEDELYRQAHTEE